MNVVSISHEWPDDEGTMTVSVEVDADYPDAIAEAKRIALDAWHELNATADED